MTPCCWARCRSRRRVRAALLDPRVELDKGRQCRLLDEHHRAAYAHDEQRALHVPCIAVAELAQGICKLHRVGGVHRAALLAEWLDQLIARFGDRILALDATAAKLAGQLSDQALARGVHPGFADIAIAALAHNAGQLLLTRNIKYFEQLGVACMDPLVKLPS